MKNRRIAGAGIDVFEREPTPSDNPLLKPDHVLLTPHTAGATRDGMRKKARAQYENFRHVAYGRPLINVTQPYSKVGAEAKAYGLNPHGLMPTTLHQRKSKIVSFSGGKGGRWIRRWDGAVVSAYRR